MHAYIQAHTYECHTAYTHIAHVQECHMCPCTGMLSPTHTYMYAYTYKDIYAICSRHTYGTHTWMPYVLHMPQTHICALVLVCCHLHIHTCMPIPTRKFMLYALDTRMAHIHECCMSLIWPKSTYVPLCWYPVTYTYMYAYTYKGIYVICPKRSYGMDTWMPYVLHMP